MTRGIDGGATGRETLGLPLNPRPGRDGGAP